MINVYSGNPSLPREDWELLNSFESMGEANKCAQDYLMVNVPRLMFLKQELLEHSDFWTLKVDYGFEKVLLIEDTTKKEATA